jgi:methyl-accepting chemotaxis protein
MSSNLQIINDWVDGKNFRPPSVSFAGIEKAQEERARKVGDQWVDEDGKIWEKTSYGKKSIPKVINALQDTNPCCSACQKEIDFSHRYDNSTYRSTKMCFDCTVELDTQRRINGTFKQYELKFVLNKQRDYVIDMLNQLEEAEKTVLDEKIEFVNEFGDLERWSGLDLNKVKEDLQKDIQEGKSTLERIDSELAKIDEQS